MRKALAVFAAVASVLGLAGCNADQVEFQAVNATAGIGGAELSLNDEIAVRFNHELDPASVSAESLRVTDADGRRIPIRARAAGEVLYLAPADADGWPAETRLAVEVPYPQLGRPLRSSLGVPNAAPFRTSVSTGKTWTSRGGPLRLVYHSLPLSGGTDVTENAEFLFEFDGPVDAATLAGGIVLEDLTHRESAPNFLARVDSPRRVTVAPFAGQAFRSGTRYKLTLTTGLRAEDTRRPAEPVSFVFATTRSRSGEHTTDFKPDHLLDSTLKPEKGPLTPLLETGVIETASFSYASRAHEAAQPFSREPSKVQILIPKEQLPTENAIITAMSFRVIGATPASMRLSARLDYAADRYADGLGTQFEDNWNLPATSHRDLIGAEAAMHVLDPAEGVVTFAFARPFFYDASDGKNPSNYESRRSLILEIVNESGVLNDSAGIALLGVDQAPDSPVRILHAPGDWSGEGIGDRFVPAVRFSVQRVRGPVVLKPWKTGTISDPVYFRRHGQILATPGFVNFIVEYRRFTEGSDPASGEGWGVDLSDLDGARSIQARIRFLLRSAEPVQKDAGVLRLTVPFRERGE